jgi:hypothetical protein
MNRRAFFGLIVAGAATTLLPPVAQEVRAAEVLLPLNLSDAIGWRALRVMNRYGTDYPEAITAIISFDRDRRVFLFRTEAGGTMEIAATSIGAIYFKQHPYRQNVDVRVGDYRNLQITVLKEFLYSVRPRDLSIQNGVLHLNSRWITEQHQFLDGSGDKRVPVVLPPGSDSESRILQIPRKISYDLGTARIQVQVELVQVIGRRSAPSSQP